MKKYIYYQIINVKLLPIYLAFSIAGTCYGKKDIHRSYNDSITPVLISTSAYSTVTGKGLYNSPAPNITNTLFGRLSGLIVSQGTQEPGNDMATLNIRGMGTYNDASATIFVDGFQVPMSYFQNISPVEIENIKILKDAAALAPYGMKGANGVILVTTRRGTNNRTKINIRARSGFQQSYPLNKPLSSYDYARLYNQAISNDNGRVWSPKYSQKELDTYKNGTGTSVDWYNETLKKRSPLTEADISIGGGNQRSKYQIIFDYLNQQGAYNVKNDDLHSNLQYKRYNLLTNLDVTLSKIFSASIGLSGRIEDRSRPNYETSSLFSNLAKYPSNIYPVRNENNSWTGNSIYPDNPVASIRELGYIQYHDRTLQANFRIKENLDIITPGLYLIESASFANYNRGTYGKIKDYARFASDGSPSTNNKETIYEVTDDYGTDSWDWKQYMISAGYDKIFNKHTISSLFNFLGSSEKMQFGNEGGTAYNYANLGGTIHYEYDKRYIAEFGFSCSGTDYYSPDNRWGFYPAASIAWIISNENFLHKCTALNLLKLRASAGKSGINNGGRYAYQQYYTYQGYYGIGSSSISSVQGVTQSTVANPEIFAEQSIKYNVGIDATFLNKLKFNADLFLDKRSGIISKNNALPATFGGVPPFSNIGKVTNKGVEAEIEFRDQWHNFSFITKASILYCSNKIDYMAEIITIPGAIKTGNPINTKFGYLADGYYQLSDFNADGSLRDGVIQSTFATVQAGDLKFKDISGPKGVPDGKIDAFDKTKIGKSDLPEITYAFQIGCGYKGFDLNMLFQGAAGRDISLLNNWNQTVPFQNNGNIYKNAQNAWAYYPEQGIDTRASATFPRLTTQSNNNNYAESDYWIKNGSFLRLREINFGWTFPEIISQKAHISKLRIFFSGENLFTISKLLKNYHIDPETFTGYPVQKIFSFGLLLNF